MYRCSVELSVRYGELSQSKREHASLIDEYTRGEIRTLFRFVNTLVQFCGEHACSVSRQFCVLDTGFALV